MTIREPYRIQRIASAIFDNSSEIQTVELWAMPLVWSIAAGSDTWAEGLILSSLDTSSSDSPEGVSTYFRRVGYWSVHKGRQHVFSRSTLSRDSSQAYLPDTRTCLYNPRPSDEALCVHPNWIDIVAETEMIII